MSRTCLFLIILFSLTFTLQAFEPFEYPGKPDLDTRLPAEETERGGFRMRLPSAEQLARAEALALEVPGLVLRWDGMSGAPRWLAAPGGGTLSPPKVGEPEGIARSFLKSNARLFGIRRQEVDDFHLTDVVQAAGGGWHVHLAQAASGIEVFGARVNVNLNRDGSVRSVGSRIYSGVRQAGAPAIASVEAVRLAALDVYPHLPFGGSVRSVQKDGERFTRFEQAGFGLPPWARLVLFPESHSVRLAWEIRLVGPALDTDYRVLIDATDGSVLFRCNTASYAEARRIDANQPEPETEEYAPEQYLLGTIPTYTTESPAGWIAGDGTSLTGNNATSHLLYPGQSGLSDISGIYDYPFNTPSSALVNAWWWTNEAHDWFYALGFDEAAGNYQQDNDPDGNGSSPGLGGDPMMVVSWTSGGRNFANYIGAPEGESSSINFRWSRCRFCGDHDGYPENGNERGMGFMRDIIIHEYAHGVTTRMVGGPAVTDCLTATQSSALGEGWSNIFADSFNDDPKHLPYFTEGKGWVTDARHDLDYDDICHVADEGCEEHGDGMIWEGALWDLRQSMRARDPVNGVRDFEELLVEALASTACYPSMLDARGGILDADVTLNGSAHHQLIWNVFAARGMGELASTTGEGDTDPVADFTVPTAHQCSPPSVPGSVTATPDGDNAIQVGYDASGASAVEIWRDDLDNPFDQAVRVAFTDSLTGYRDETVQGGKSYRYHVIAHGGGGIVCRSDPSSTADAMATGICQAFPVLDPGLTVIDGDPGCALTLDWNSASEGCPGSGAPIVYNIYRAPTPGFDPAERFLIGRTAGLTFQDVPPDTDEDDFGNVLGDTAYYLVLAQHGDLDDPADHGDRGPSQLLRWVPGLPTLGRETAYSWDFDTGGEGWTTNNTDDPDGGWVRVDPSPTYYADSLLAPDEPAGGSGMSWVTGDAGGTSSVTDHDCDGFNYLISPEFDGTGGATILSFDYWAHEVGNFWEGIEVWIENGSATAGSAPVALMTAPDFMTDGRRGWQKAELDLADFITPTATMQVKFRSYCAFYLTEFGIDNVRIERATPCDRPGLLLDSVTVDDSPEGWGNGNGVLDPGETALLAVTLYNEGDATALSPTGILVGASPGMLIHEEMAGFPDIPVAGTGSSTGAGFTVTAPVGGRCEDTLTFEFEITDALGTTSRPVWSPEFGYSVTDIVFEDTFETDKGWDTSIGFEGRGRWERGDPVGTTDGSNQVNPENDSPNDTGAQCYVTDNGSPGGAPDLNDVDGFFGVFPILESPGMDLTGYKRASFQFDLWYFDDTSSDPNQDYGFYQTYFDESYFKKWWHYPVTIGWETINRDITPYTPMAPGLQLVFAAYDRVSDNLVEMGVDNVVVEGELQVCDDLGVADPPNGIGDTLRVDKTAEEIELSWQASPTDASHDGAAYYDVYASGTPDAGFSGTDTATATATAWSLDPATEYFKISAVNSAGGSGDEPAP